MPDLTRYMPIAYIIYTLLPIAGELQVVENVLFCDPRNLCNVKITILIINKCKI